MKRSRAELATIGWREWVSLPELGIEWVKAKIDTGAASSSLHAIDVQLFDVPGGQRVRFRVHPMQRETKTTVTCEADVVELRHVRSSSGHGSTRPVIATPVRINGQVFAIELTLADRAEMGFRMLLGRQALRGRFNVDVTHSFLGRHPEAHPPERRRKRISR